MQAVLVSSVTYAATKNRNMSSHFRPRTLDLPKLYRSNTHLTMRVRSMAEVYMSLYVRVYFMHLHIFVYVCIFILTILSLWYNLQDDGVKKQQSNPVTESPSQPKPTPPPPTPKVMYSF